jgi:hypothetical protein
MEQRLVRKIAWFVSDIWFQFLGRYQFFTWLTSFAGVFLLICNWEYITRLNTTPSIVFYVLGWYPAIQMVAGIICLINGVVDVEKLTYLRGGGYLGTVVYGVGSERRVGTDAIITGILSIVVGSLALATLWAPLHADYPDLLFYGADGEKLGYSANIDFRNVAVGSGGKQISVVITNPGEGKLKIERIKPESVDSRENLKWAQTDFSMQSHLPMLLQPGESASIILRFAPRKAGVQMCYLELITNIDTSRGHVLSPSISVKGTGS